MAKKKRVTRKALLKEPDEFMTFTGRMIQFAKKYQQQILYGLGALAVVALIVSGLRFYFGWQENRAFTALDKALSQYRDGQSEKPDLTAVKAKFQAVADGYSRYGAGKLARVMYANICYDSGDFETAIAAYSRALKSFNDDPTVMLFIQNSLGYAHEAKEDYQAAADYFEKVATSPNAFLKDEALYNLGRLYARLGKAEKSKDAYDKILSDYPDSLYIELVKETNAG